VIEVSYRHRRGSRAGIVNGCRDETAGAAGRRSKSKERDQAEKRASPSETAIRKDLDLEPMMREAATISFSSQRIPHSLMSDLLSSQAGAQKEIDTPLVPAPIVPRAKGKATQARR
jgi:hypothetical protein